MWNKERHYYVYILASKIGGTLYIGVTNNLIRRVYEHREKLADGFTEKYGVHRLVYFEQHSDIEAAIKREKRLKKWNRRWKIQLIEETIQIGPICTQASPSPRSSCPRKRVSSTPFSPAFTGSSAFADDDTEGDNDILTDEIGYPLPASTLSICASVGVTW